MINYLKLEIATVVVDTCGAGVGNQYNVKPGCPNLIERIESALLSYGNDFDNNDNPFECGFDQYVSLDSEVEFLGKENLKKIKSEGALKKLKGVKIDLQEISIKYTKNICNK